MRMGIALRRSPQPSNPARGECTRLDFQPAAPQAGHTRPMPASHLLQELPATYKSQFFAMVGAEAVIWTPVQYINFTMLPVQHQQMFVNVVAIIEAAVLSWCALLSTSTHHHSP